jgi:hypothetical protein
MKEISFSLLIGIEVRRKVIKREEDARYLTPKG